MTIAEFSRKINYTPEYVGAVIHKKVSPGRKMMAIIEKATEGEVTIEELSLKDFNKNE